MNIFQIQIPTHNTVSGLLVKEILTIYKPLWSKNN